MTWKENNLIRQDPVVYVMIKASYLFISPMDDLLEREMSTLSLSICYPSDVVTCDDLVCLPSLCAFPLLMCGVILTCKKENDVSNLMLSQNNLT